MFVFVFGFVGVVAAAGVGGRMVAVGGKTG